MTAFLSFDMTLLWQIQAWFASPFLDHLMPVITHLGDGGIFWLLLSGLLLLRKSTRRAGCLVLLSMALCLIVGNGMIKPLCARPRPYAADPSIVLLIPPSPDPFSFPSGHTMHSFAVACALFFSKQRKLFLPALVLACFIGFSRVYLMMHYPLDVLAGAVLGVLGAFVASKLLPHLENSAQKHRKNAF